MNTDEQFDRVFEAFARNRRRKVVPEDPARVRARRREELANGAPKTLHEKAVAKRKKRKNGGHK